MLEVFRSPRRAAVWLVEASLLATLCSILLGVHLSGDPSRAAEPFACALFISLVAQASLYYHGLYDASSIGKRQLVTTSLRALGVAFGALWILFHLFPYDHVGKGTLVVAFATTALVVPAWRTLFDRVTALDSMKRNIVILGGGKLARECARLVANDASMKLVAVLASDAEPRELPVHGGYADLKRFAGAQRADHIVVAAHDRRGRLPLDELLELKFRGVTIEEGVDFYERITGRLFVRELKPSHVIFAHGFQVRRSTLALKRALDLVAASVGLLLAAPIMLLTAIAIKLDSKGPVLYSQVRAGAFGKPFTIHKFRSMRTDAEAKGAVWAQENDPRVTRVGSFIRKTRIDELPQLWNVLKGEMSLVGPRPERPVFIEELEREIPFFRQRLCVKPGVTGHAQVRCKYGASKEDALEKLQYDLYYIKSVSIWFDLSVLIDTVKVVLGRIGAR